MAGPAMFSSGGSGCDVAAGGGGVIYTYFRCMLYDLDGINQIQIRFIKVAAAFLFRMDLFLEGC